MKTSPTNIRSRRTRLAAGVAAALAFVTIPTAASAKVGIVTGSFSSYSWGTGGSQPKVSGGTVFFNDCNVTSDGIPAKCGLWKAKSVLLSYYIKGSTYQRSKSLTFFGTSIGNAAYSALPSNTCSNKPAAVAVTWTWNGKSLPPYPSDTKETISGFLSGGVAC